MYTRKVANALLDPQVIKLYQALKNAPVKKPEDKGVNYGDYLVGLKNLGYTVQESKKILELLQSERLD